MSKKPVLPILDIEISPLKKSAIKRKINLTPRTLLFVLILLSMILLLGCFFLQKQQTINSQELQFLKDSTQKIHERIQFLESSPQASEPADKAMAQIHQLETHLTTLQQQLEALQNQPKPSEQSHAFIQSISHLQENQSIIKLILSFWRLKEKVRSHAPYSTELATFKALSPSEEDLSLLEKYENQGLQILLESSEIPDSSSWITYFKNMLTSLMKIEKIDEATLQPTTFEQDCKMIEDLFMHIDQSLSQQLIPPTSPPPLSGETSS